MASRASAPSARATSTKTRRATGNHRRTMIARLARSRVARASNGEGDEEFRASVDGLREPCDDFVCKSSPAVENTLKSLIKDVNAARGTNRSAAPYSPDVTYDDGALRFAGSEKYKRYCSYIENNLRQVTTRVTEISMEGSLDVGVGREERHRTRRGGRGGDV